MLELNWQRAILVHLGGQLANRKDEMYRAAAFFRRIFTISSAFEVKYETNEAFVPHQLKKLAVSRSGHNETHDTTSESEMKFTEFCSDIKSYFVAHPEEYRRFRKCDTVRKKLAFLVQNGMVRKKLILLKKSKIPAKKVNMPEYAPSAKRDWRKRSGAGEEAPPLNPKSKQVPDSI